MKSVKYDRFIPYSLEQVWEVMQDPSKLEVVPGATETHVISDMEWNTGFYDPKTDSVNMTENRAEYDFAKHSIVVTMTSKEKKMEDTCVLTLYRVGDFRTKINIEYQFQYLWYNPVHWMAMLAMKAAGTSMLWESANTVSERVKQLCTEAYEEEVSEEVAEEATEEVSREAMEEVNENIKEDSTDEVMHEAMEEGDK